MILVAPCIARGARCEVAGKNRSRGLSWHKAVEINKEVEFSSSSLLVLCGRFVFFCNQYDNVVVLSSVK